MTLTCTIVVPCFNEARRLDVAQLEALATAADARVLAVDDGSTDDTAGVLGRLAADDPARYGVVSLDRNRGKGEAVRHGLLAAIEEGADVVGYCDADFATPPDEVARLVDAVRADDGVDVVLGSRVALLGSDVRRSTFRHYTGRLFATAGSLVLRVSVYDTQCGAKAFRTTDGLQRALSTPFVSRWAFDVELLGRLLQLAGGRLVELPLQRWHAQAGSSMTMRAGARAMLDLLRIHRRLRPRRWAAATDSADGRLGRVARIRPVGGVDGLDKQGHQA